MPPPWAEATAALPVHAALAGLTGALDAGNRAVLHAPPGAGKTTVVPLALLDRPWAAGGRVVMLEPRRLATRAAAARMASLLGEPVGRTVGHRMRDDTRVGRSTRIEVVTEGVFTRMLHDDTGLDGIAAVVFDEFHERSVDTDLGLALTLDAQAALRPDLRVVVMSATLDGLAVAALLGGAPVVAATGRMHPVETVWAPPGSPAPAAFAATDARGYADRVARTVQAALARDGGDVLVFLPGAAEIRRVAERLPADGAVDVLTLHGSLAADVQDAAIAPARPGRRKVVLSTAIAETSLTIEGVRIVVDGGLARVPRLDHRRGMAALATVSVSQSSAEQRRGRAGRTAPGVCHRLWSEHDHARLPAAAEPEILVADLAPLALDLARWGVTDPGELAWLDPPPAAALGVARTVLRELGALDDDHRITPDGRRMSGLGLHPRLARMVLGADVWDATGLACDLAALLSERDIVGGRPAERGADVRERLVLLRSGRSGSDATVRRVRRQSASLRRRLGTGSQADDLDRAGPVLALAYPDRIARRRSGSTGDRRYLLADGTGASLPGSDPLAGADLLVVADRMPAVRGTHRGDDLIVLAAAIDLDDVEAVAGPDIELVEEVTWDGRAGEVTARRQRRLGAVVLADAPLADPPHGAAVAALLDGVRAEGLGLLPFTPEIEQWRHRVALLRRVLGDDWPDLGDAALLDGLDDWLAPRLTKARRRADLTRVPLQAALEARLDWDRRRRLDELAPTHVQVPSGSRIRIDYGVDPPVLAVRLQEVFGLTVTPAVVGGRVPLVLHLLSPAGRPVQVTADLAGFWSGAYAQVRSELRGRYPRHAWPDDPLTAPPTRRPTHRRRPG